jgi:molybdate transport system ATP-binding protein
MASLRSSAGEWWIVDAGLEPGQPVRAKIGASDVIVATARPAGLTASNIVPATVEAASEEGAGHVLVHLASGTDHLVARVTKRSVHALGLVAGTPVFAIVKSVAIESMSIGPGAGGPAKAPRR